MFRFLTRKPIEPEALVAYRDRLPEKLDVVVKRSDDGGYYVEVLNLPGLVTEADDVRSLFEMVNDAVFTYLEIPESYSSYLAHYLPPTELVKSLGGSIEKLTDRKVVFART